MTKQAALDLVVGISVTFIASIPFMIYLAFFDKESRTEWLGLVGDYLIKKLRGLRK